MQYNRLTKRDADGNLWTKCKECAIYDKCDFSYDVCCEELTDRLAELEDMIEQNVLIKLPCKIGDTIYTVEYSRYRDEWFIEEHKVLEFVICKNDIHFVDDYGSCVYIAFPTQAEAEAELAKIRGKKQ